MASSQDTPGAAASNPADTVAASQPPNASTGRPAAAVPPSLFGGHRGGGKKRADGLAAGSPEALAADREKNRLRMAEKRAAQKATPLPAVLQAGPAVATVAPLPDSAPPLGAGEPAVLGVAPGVAGPLVVPWTVKLLEKPARLVTRILDRLRVASLRKKIDASPLPPELKKEVAADLEWKQQAREDFAMCLADCAQIELNKRRVPGSDNAHWINLSICGGELALAHIEVCERLDKLIESSGKPKPDS